MARKVYLGAVAVLALTAPATGALQGVTTDSGDIRIGISGYVPVICRTSLEAQTVTPVDGRAALGALREFCNNPNGYAIQADYSPALAGGALIVDGVSIPLEESGTVEITRSSQAGIAKRSVELELPENVEAGALSFRIQPL